MTISLEDRIEAGVQALAQTDVERANPQDMTIGDMVQRIWPEVNEAFTLRMMLAILAINGIYQRGVGQETATFLMFLLGFQLGEQVANGAALDRSLGL